MSEIRNRAIKNDGNKGNDGQDEVHDNQAFQCECANSTLHSTLHSTLKLCLKPVFEEAAYVIPHDKAYRHTKNTIAGMVQAMEDYRVRGGQNLPPTMRQMVLDGMQSLIEEWSVQMRAYEAHQSVRGPEDRI